MVVELRPEYGEGTNGSETMDREGRTAGAEIIRCMGLLCSNCSKPTSQAGKNKQVEVEVTSLRSHGLALQGLLGN